MKASELIKQLQNLINICGDLEVEIPETDDCYYGHGEIKEITITHTKDGQIIELCRR